MQHDAGTLHAADGLTLATRRWLPNRRPKAAVALVHGIGEHSGRYAHVATHLMLHGYGAYAFDLRGHGRSEGEPRAYAESFDAYVGDLDRFLDSVRAERRAEPRRPLFLYGHSLGGAIAAAYVIERGADGLAGLVLSSAALRIPADLSPLLQKAAGVLSRFVPRLPVSKLDTSHLSRDPAVVRAYEEDPLVYTGGVRARVGAEVLRVTEHVQQHADAFALPLYLYHGTADRITDPAGSRWLHEHAPAADKSLKLYEGLYHETHNEPERERVLDDLTAWLDAHV
jgi:alpha-beta hydrolase superfamily lysophospholipase